MRFISWNIDSLNAALTGHSPRAGMTRAILQSLADFEADFIALQETKLPPGGPTEKHRKILEELFPAYAYAGVFAQEPARKSYAGVMIFYRKGRLPAISCPRLQAPDTMDAEGRILTLDFQDFYFTTVYTPNAGEALRRLPERQIWDRLYGMYLQRLDAVKPLIACGDFNVAHEEIDLAYPENNRRSAGFTDEEREGFSRLLSLGFTDSFRYVHGDKEVSYTWWAQRVKTSKINNAGWRIDYFLVSNRLASRIQKADMIDSGERQDHAPIFLEIDLR